MSKIIYYIFGNLYSIKLLFSGINEFETKDKDLIINTDIHNIDIPGIGDDKANLKSDRVKVLKDYNKGYKAKIKELNTSCPT